MLLFDKIFSADNGSARVEKQLASANSSMRREFSNVKSADALNNVFVISNACAGRASMRSTRVRAEGKRSVCVQTCCTRPNPSACSAFRCSPRVKNRNAPWYPNLIQYQDMSKGGNIISANDTVKNITSVKNKTFSSKANWCRLQERVRALQTQGQRQRVLSRPKRSHKPTPEPNPPRRLGHSPRLQTRHWSWQ